jgi:hypothetical protein
MTEDPRESFFDALARGLGSAMRRRLTALLAMVVMAVMLAASPAFADKGGLAHEGSCGFGAVGAQLTVADPTSPGATEFALIHPSEENCL